MNLYRMTLVAAGVAVLSGCVAVAAPTSNGLLFTKMQGPITTGKATRASKTGTACATNILGLVATGDASIDAAKKAGGINDVAVIDHDSTSVLGVYGKFCTVVRGE